jgi:hypothetical protein
MDDLAGVLQQAVSGNAPAADVHAAYDKVAAAVPQSDLAEGISHAFKSDQTPPFEQMVSGLFSQSSGDQKASLLNQFLGAIGPGGLAQALGGAGGLAGLAGVLGGGGSVTPQQAQEVPPEAVQVLAQRAAAKDPGIVDQAASFYAQHPTLVKAIGAGALALLMSRISGSRR